MGATATVAFSVPDISCAHCEQTVKSALAPVSGVSDVAVDLPGKVVNVRYDANEVGVERLGEILAAEGYPAEPINR